MKKLILSLIVAISLAVGVAGSAAATVPDNQACGATSGTPGLVHVAAAGGGTCGAHGAP